MLKKRKSNSQGSLEQQQQDPHLPPSTPPAVSNMAPPSPALDPPPMLWEERSQCLGPILRHNSLPLVVKCEKRGMSLENISGFDFTQPLMLHTRRNVRKVVAASLQLVRVVSGDGSHHEGEADSGGGAAGGGGGGMKLREVGDHLLIPEDYKGWFAVLGPLQDVTAERVVPHFRQVALLALSNCESFLVGGKEPVEAVQMPSSGMGGNSCVQPRLIYPGDVLRMGKIYVGESIIVVKKMFGGKKTIKKEEKFLLCTDDKDREVYLPVEKRGTFYVLTTEGHGAPKIPIMRMPDICTRFRFPTVVKLLFGRVPTTPCDFTGTMVLRDSRMESSVIGCTMVSAHNILLDIPIDSDLRFLMAQHTHDLLASRCYKNAKTLCHDKASTYMRNMKVAYYIDDKDVEEAAGGLGDDIDADSKVGERGLDGGRSREAEAKVASYSSSSSAPTTPSRGSNSVSDCLLSRSVSCTQPSIVEDQELFCPPETKTPESPRMQTPVGSRKAGRKSVDGSSAIGGGGGGSSGGDPHRHSNSASTSVVTNSPTVLRKDQQFYLPDPEVLPLKHATSAPALSGIEKRPLPPVVQRPPADNTLPNGHYMTMDETTARQWPGSRKPPDSPAKCNSSDSMNIYMQAWDGKTLGGDAQADESSATPAQTTSSSDSSSPPALRPKKLRVSGIVHRVSSFAFDNTYLTVPVFSGSGDSTPTTSAPTTARSEVTSTSSSSQGSDYYLTPCPTIPRPSSDTAGVNRAGSSPSAMKQRFSGEPNLTLSPPPPSADQQTYETMSLTTRTAAKQGTNTRNDSQYTPMSAVTDTAAKQRTSAMSYSQYTLMSAVYQQEEAAGERGTSPKRPPKPPAPCSAYYNIHDAGLLAVSKPLPPCPPLPPLPSSVDSQPPAVPPAPHQIQFVNTGLSDVSVSWSESTWCSGDQRFGSQASATNSAHGPGQRNGTGSGFPGHSIGHYEEMALPVSDARGSPEEHSRDFVHRDQLQDAGYIYYESYGPAVPEQGKRSSVSPEEAKAEQARRESSTSLSTVSEHSSWSEEGHYENVENIRPYKARQFTVSCSAPCLTPSDSNNNGNKTNHHHSQFFDKFVNPPSIFNYVSPPPPRPATPSKPLVPKKPKHLVKTNTLVSNNSDAVGMTRVNTATAPPPPKPCGIKQRQSDNDYLTACKGSSENTLAGLPHSHSSGSIDRTVPVRFSQGSVGGNIAEELTRERNVAMNAVCQASGDWSADDLDASSCVSEDELPLGASFDNFRSPVAVSDSGCAVSSVSGANRRTTCEGRDKGGRASNSRGVDDASTLSVAGLCEALKSVGLTKETLEILREKKVNGGLLLSLSEEELREALPDVKILDFKRIMMFMNGLRPVE